MPPLNRYSILLSLSIAIIGIAFGWYKTYPLKFDQSAWREARQTQDLQTLYRMSEDLNVQIDNGLIKTSRDAIDLLGVGGVTSSRIPLKAPFLGGPYYFLLQYNADGKLIAHGVYPD